MASPKTPPQPVQPGIDLPAGLRFEVAVAELESIVRSMEGGAAGALDLESSIAAYQRGMALLKHCQAQLADAEERIRVLTPAASGETP